MSFNQDLIRSEYPFKPNSLDIDGHNLSYLDEGPKDAPVLLLLHGNPTWSFYYRKLVLGLSDRFRVIVPDHIGCGMSDKPQDYDYTLATHINNFEKLLDHLKLKKFSLGVHDWGGAIGFGYATRYPEKIRSLIVFNTAAFLIRRIPPSIAICRAPIFGDIAVRGFNLFVKAAVNGMATSKKERFTPPVTAGYLAPYDSWANRVGILRFVQDIPLSRRDKSYETLKDIDDKLCLLKSVPMTIFWGMRDFCFDHVFLDEWIKRFNNATVHRFEDAGHFVVEDAYERIIPAMRDFLEEKA